MATKAIKFTKRQFRDSWKLEGVYDATIADINEGVITADDGTKQKRKDTNGNQVWFVNFDLDKHRNFAVHNRWSESDDTTFAFAVFTSKALDACGIEYTEEDLSKDFAGLVEIWKSKLIGQKVKIQVSLEPGEKDGREFVRVQFL